MGGSLEISISLENFKILIFNLWALRDWGGQQFSRYFSLVGSPQMWVWPQLVFGGSPPYPIVIGGPFPQAKPFPPRPLLPSSPHPPWLFLQGSGRGRPRLVGRGGPRAQGGGGGGVASKRHLGPNPHLGVLDLVALGPKMALCQAAVQACGVKAVLRERGT